MRNFVMKWHSSSTLPVTNDSCLCIVQYMHPVSESQFEIYYEVVAFHNNTQSFSKLSDSSGVNSLKNEFIVKWAYIEEDDDIIEEQNALLTISAAINHLKNLIELNLTDMIVTPKDYRDEIGLNNLLEFENKIGKRIEKLDKHWE